ncbi:ScbR family autoregulator-binding transcription factor, partial [Motilibacter deserti]
YLGASLTDIVNEAETTKGALYFHFASKDHLAAAVVHEQYAAWPALIAKVSAEHEGPLAQLRALSYEVARAFREDIVVRAGIRLAAERAVIGVELPTPYVGWIDQTTGLLRHAQEIGQMRPGLDPPAVARTLIAAFFGVQSVSQVLSERRDLEERLDDLWDLVLPALAPTPDQPPAAPAS